MLRSKNRLLNSEFLANDQHYGPTKHLTYDVTALGYSLTTASKSPDFVIFAYFIAKDFHLCFDIILCVFIQSEIYLRYSCFTGFIFARMAVDHGTTSADDKKTWRERGYAFVDKKNLNHSVRVSKRLFGCVSKIGAATWRLLKLS